MPPIIPPTLPIHPSVPLPVTRHPHIGAPELYEIGQALVAMFCYCDDEHHPLPFVTLREDPQRHHDHCPVCSFAGVPGGSFTLTHHHIRLGLTLPYLAAHMLAAHGYAGDYLRDVDSLRTLLGLEDRALGRRLVGLASGAAPEPGIGVMHEQVKGHQHCKHCDDALNLGTVSFSREGHSVALHYIELHSLYEHADPHWADADGKAGVVDLEVVRKLIDGGNQLVELGKRLAAILPFLGGEDKPPPWLRVDEHPMRGIEACRRCDETVNMGTFDLTDTRPLRPQTMSLPYLAVHTLIEHASAHYMGELHTGTVNVRQLRRMLGPVRG